MTQVGDIYELTPGERLTVRTLSAELLVVEVEWAAVKLPPVSHLHPRQDEHFTIHEGELTVELDGEVLVVRGGDQLDIPRATPHRMWNSGSVTARATWQVRPPGRTVELWAALDAARRRPDTTDGRGMLTPAAAMAILEAHADELRLARPAPVERVSG